MVSKHLKALGLGRIWRLDEELDPPQRYEYPTPGGMFHIDAKKLARIDGVGHMIPWDDLEAFVSTIKNFLREAG